MILYSQKPYCWKTIWRCSLGIAIMSIAMKFIPGGAGVMVLVPFMLLAFSRNDPIKLFYSVILLILVTMGNPYFFPKGMAFSLIERATLVVMAFLMGLRIAGRKGSAYVSPLAGMIWYIAYMVLPSLFGWSFLVSGLKLFLFVSIYLAFYAVSNEAIKSGSSRTVEVRSIMLSVAIFFLVGSVMTIPFPQIGLMKIVQGEKILLMDSLFMGMTQHSQSLGPIVASVGTLIFADLVFSIKRFDPLYVILLICVPILVWKSSSRTAMGSLLAGFSIVSYFLCKARGIGGKWRGKVISIIIIVIAVVAGGLMCSSSMRGDAVSFLLKADVDDAQMITVADVTSSRQALVETSMYNFKKKPMIGNGFQVSEEMNGYGAGEFKLLLTAPIEKGVWLAAVLEEGGVFGMSIFVLFIIIVLSSCFKHKAYITASTFCVLLISNLGEFTMFSMSYTGGMMWAMVFAGTVMDALRNSGDRNALNFNFR